MYFWKRSYLILLVLLTVVPVAGCTGSLPRGTSVYPSATPPATTAPKDSVGGTTAIPTLSATPGQEEQPEVHSTPLPSPVPKPSYGVQIHVPPGWDADQTLERARGLGVGWVKEQVQWHTVEHGPGDFDWKTLDQVVAGADRFGFKLLLGVTHAPDWTRTVEAESGPPADYGEFQRFMEQMARRYQGRVEAYELWNEPNLAREWRGDTLDASRFVRLLAEGATGVRIGDPEALVISGAPAVTGINDEEVAVGDRQFVRGMVEGGVFDYVDALGAHPYGYGNPPEESVEDGDHVASSHNNHPTFFFRDTLEDYHQIMMEYGFDDREIWVTEFGWPTPEGIGEMDLTGWEYGREVTEAQQAEYTVRAFHMGDERPWVGPMFLWNLNLAVIWGPENAFSAYSLLRPDGSFRPSYIALRLTQPLGP